MKESCTHYYSAAVNADETGPGSILLSFPIPKLPSPVEEDLPQGMRTNTEHATFILQPFTRRRRTIMPRTVAIKPAGAGWAQGHADSDPSYRREIALLACWPR